MGRYEMALAERSIKEEGTIFADDLEAELGNLVAEDRIFSDCEKKNKSCSTDFIPITCFCHYITYSN